MFNMVGRQGFEPRYRRSERRVLPLDDLPINTGILALFLLFRISDVFFLVFKAKTPYLYPVVLECN
jgi:hypothetical protein